MTGRGAQTRRQMRRKQKKQRQQERREPLPWEQTAVAPARPFILPRMAVLPPTVQAVTLSDFARLREPEDITEFGLSDLFRYELDREKFEQDYHCTPEAFMKRWPDLADEHVAMHCMIYCEAMFLSREHGI